MSRATNSFHHIKAHAEGVDANQRSDALRVAIADAITVLATALDGSVALEEIEKAVFNLQQQHPPTLMLSEVEVALCSMVRTIVLAGNATLKAEMALIDPRAVGELPEPLIETARVCLDHFMLTSEQRTTDALVSLQQMLQAQCVAPDPDTEVQVDTLKTHIADLENTARTVDTTSTADESLAAKAVAAAHQTMVQSMAVITEKTFTIQVCRDTVDKLEQAKKTVSASNKAARRALMGDPTAVLPDIAEEQKMQQNIDAEMKDMLTAERERNVFACQCLNVPMVLKTSYKVNVDALRALGKMIGSKVSAHWDAERANEVKTLQSRFITDNIHVLYALAPMSARLRDHGTGTTWRVPTVQDIKQHLAGEDNDQYYARLVTMGFAAMQPEKYLIDEYVSTRGITPAQADALLRQEQIMAIQREYVNANEFAFSHLKEQLPLVVPQIVLSCGQIMGDSSSEIVNKAAEHDYMSVIEQLVMASSTHSVFQADDAKDSLRASAGLFMMEDWREGVRLLRTRIQACANLNITVTHAATVYKFMLKMRGGNPAAFNHLQLEYANIPAADAKRDYLPRLVTFVGAFEHFMSITRSADRRLGGTKKHRAAVVKQAMAYESDDSDDEERAMRTFDVKPRSGTPLSFKTKEEQQKQAVRNNNGRRLCDVRGCGAVPTASEIEVVGKVQTKSDHRYKGSRFFKKDCSYGPFKQARCDACCRKAHQSGIPSIMRDGFKLKGYAVDKVRVTRDEPEPEHE